MLLSGSSGDPSIADRQWATPGVVPAEPSVPIPATPSRG